MSRERVACVTCIPLYWSNSRSASWLVTRLDFTKSRMTAWRSCLLLTALTRSHDLGYHVFQFLRLETDAPRHLFSPLEEDYRRYS